MLDNTNTSRAYNTGDLDKLDGSGLKGGVYPSCIVDQLHNDTEPMLDVRSRIKSHFGIYLSTVMSIVFVVIF